VELEKRRAGKPQHSRECTPTNGQGVGPVK
jgi:hypothetical protein